MTRRSMTIDLADVSDDRRRLAEDLDSARQELKDAILRATQISRRVRDLEWSLRRAEMRDDRRQAASG